MEDRRLIVAFFMIIVVLLLILLAVSTQYTKTIEDATKANIALELGDVGKEEIVLETIDGSYPTSKIKIYAKGNTYIAEVKGSEIKSLSLTEVIKKDVLNQKE